LSRQPDALRLAARERGRAAVQGQVAQAHGVEEAQALLDLSEQLLADLLLGAPQAQAAEELQAPLDRERGELVDVLAPEPHRQGRGAEAGAVAGGAGRPAAEALEGLVVGEVPDVPHGGEDAAPLPGADVLAGVRLAHGLVGVVDALAQEQRLLHAVRLVSPGQGEIGPGDPGDLAHDVVGDAGEGQLLLVAEGQQRLGQGTVGVDHQLQLEVHQLAQPLAGRAGALGCVEAEQARLELGDGDVGVVGAGAVSRPEAVFVADHHGQGVLRHGQAALDGLDHPQAALRGDLDPVQHDLDGVLLVAGQDDVLVQAPDAPVDACADPAVRAQLLELLAVLALALAHDGRHQHQDRPHRLGQQVVRDLTRGQGGDGPVALGAVGGAQSSQQQPQVVQDLGDRPHRRAGVAVHRLLVDGDRGGQALDVVDLGLLHLAEELPRVGRQGLHEAALPLLVDRVECEAGLAAAGEPREDHEAVARQLQVDALEVVLAGVDDPDRVVVFGVCGHAAG
jgi:hypothetical protein